MATARSKKELDAALATWVAVNNFLRDATEGDCLKLLQLERAGGNRLQYVLRIHARFNKTRAARERKELRLPPLKARSRK